MKLMSLLLGKSKSSCNADSDEESSMSLELHESDPWQTSMAASILRVVVPESALHLVDEEDGVVSSLLNVSPTSEFHRRRKKSEPPWFPAEGGDGVRESDSLERRASASRRALSH